jgi:hypothetical protein
MRQSVTLPSQSKKINIRYKNIQGSKSPWIFLFKSLSTIKNKTNFRKDVDKSTFVVYNIRVDVDSSTSAQTKKQKRILLCLTDLNSFPTQYPTFTST